MEGRRPRPHRRRSCAARQEDAGERAQEDAAEEECGGKGRRAREETPRSVALVARAERGRESGEGNERRGGARRLCAERHDDVLRAGERDEQVHREELERPRRRRSDDRERKARVARAHPVTCGEGERTAGMTIQTAPTKGQ